LPVGAIPRYSPFCVPRNVVRVATLSPLATTSSMVMWTSGNAVRSRVMRCFKPSRPFTSGAQ
jgi:hypothetical protein